MLTRRSRSTRRKADDHEVRMGDDGGEWTALDVWRLFLHARVAVCFITDRQTAAISRRLPLIAFNSCLLGRVIESAGLDDERRSPARPPAFFRSSTPLQPLRFAANRNGSKTKRAAIIPLVFFLVFRSFVFFSAAWRLVRELQRFSCKTSR